MNKVKDYFINDFPSCLAMNKILDCKEVDQITKSEKLYCQITARLHLDFSSNSLFISYYIPSNIKLINLIDILLNPQTVLSFQSEVHVSGGFFFERPITVGKMQFTNLIYIYTDADYDKEKQVFLEEADKRGLIVIIRDNFYATKKNELALPRAFISHDSRDKSEIVRPLCENLSRRLCTIWFDEYSLRIGDSLRDSIESGIKNCKKCIVVISPHFISNSRWTKKEFNSIFQREIVEGQNVMLPIWHNVTKEQVYNYCPSLLDIAALNTSDGLDVIENKLFQKLMYD